MSPGRPVLGALQRSRRDSTQKLPRNATRTVGCTEKRPKSKEHRRHSLWHLAGVEARAFGAAHGNNKLRRLGSKMAILPSLILYERRMHPSGQAVCLLRLRRTRFCGIVAAVVVLVFAAAAVSPYAGAALATAMIVLLARGAVRAGRGLGAETRLRTLSPPGAHLYVHSLASTLPGAGAELLRDLAREADDKRWSMILDASNEKLSKYYENFGFLALGPAVHMPDGSSHLRMWRPAPPVDKGNYDRGTEDGRQ